MENYRQIKVLGKGSFGSAWLVQRIKDNAQFVAKEVRLSNMKPAERESAKHEITMLRQLQHPNITRYVDHFEHRGALFIVMEYANGGDLYTKIKSRNGQRFTEKDILHYFTQLCLALLHMHEHRVLHRDLKSQNVFLTADGIVKLGDFGISTVLRNTYELKRTVCGTPYYFSPELCLNKPYNNKSDVWALGCILYELTTLTHAFDGRNFNALVQKILKGVYPPIHPSYSSDLSKLVASMLKIDPNQRPNVQQIMQLPFIRNFLGGLEAEMRGAADMKKPLVPVEERQRLQVEAQARVEANKGAEELRQKKASEAAEARDLQRNQRLEAAQKAMEQQIREHEARLHQIRDNQKKYEDEQAKRKKELEERMKEQRRVQQERAMQQAKVQKLREEEWEKNMKQQQDDNKRRLELQQQQLQQGAMSPTPRVTPSPTPGAAAGGGGGAAAYDASDAARIYREMRREAQANKQRALDAPVSSSPQQFHPQANPFVLGGVARPNGNSPIQRNSPVVQPSSAAQPSPQRPQMSEADAEEARRNAYWQMRREAEENKRRMMGFEPSPVSNAAPAPPSLAQQAPQVRRSPPPTPPEQQQATPPAARSPQFAPRASPVAQHSPAPIVVPAAAAVVAGDSSDDEEVGYHAFLNGEAVAQGHRVGDSGDEGGAGEYKKMHAAIQDALRKSSAVPIHAIITSPNAAVAAGGDDFGDPDENDPTRFIMEGQTLHLPNCTMEDPLMSRIESLRMFLEASLGEDRFIQAYRLLDGVGESDDDTIARVENILPPTQHRFIPVISQLLVCEAFFNRQ